ncbi:hydrogenase maturation nickel metallochaperone HypA [Coriobacteriia bacterium Es71-Z0120]|jgi:hydrogenase nickel incorporation protein HypA/HybF|uniref:hydrogenase maturation nickel metallochaperone HypA n=1 Tax=Parvivirga hydrogeniphila TaxID=2939460 RepID=UPI002260F485|nr:hydrogenase maturation nickel metallochaperone HypA [Parvivirga hydrogeniphila]MCL4079308.1 hydrogenase maturation nickel metallochaperone HypA [Parvivirga hydrogeniphila]
MGICDGILTSAVQAATESGASRIERIEVSIGELTEVMDDALRFAFEALKEGTMAEGAELVVHYVEARSQCTECGAVFRHDRFDPKCPECGSYVITLVQGRELRIDAIDVE